MTDGALFPSQRRTIVVETKARAQLHRDLRHGTQKLVMDCKGLKIYFIDRITPYTHFRN